MSLQGFLVSIGAGLVGSLIFHIFVVKVCDLCGCPTEDDCDD